jgi:hypothetical protein
MGSFKNLLLQKHLPNFNHTWHKSSLGIEDSRLLKQKGMALLQGEIIAKE